MHQFVTSSLPLRWRLWLVMLAILTMVVNASPSPVKRSAADSFFNFNTHSAYGVVRQGRGINDNQLLPDESCHPVQFWLLSRHGTRYCAKWQVQLYAAELAKMQDKIRQARAAGRCQLSEPEVSAIMAWTMEAGEAQANTLHETGRKELTEIADRAKRRLPTLLGDPGKPDTDFQFYYGKKTQRTRASAQVFSQGLRGKVPGDNGRVTPFVDFFAGCPAYKDHISHFRAEMDKFDIGPEINATRQRIATRLGLSVVDVDIPMLTTMSMQCQYDRAWSWYRNTSAPWCLVFEKEDFLVMEYRWDMREYYRSGYGWDKSEKLGCYVAKNLVETLMPRSEPSASGTNSQRPAADLYFSHDSLFNLLVVHLGLFKDNATLRADNFHELGGRLWRTSTFSPFGSNFQAVLYECDSTGTGGDPDRYRIQVLLNEEPLTLRGCSSTLCPWREFMASVGRAALDDCDINDLCRHGQETYTDDHAEE